MDSGCKGAKHQWMGARSSLFTNTPVADADIVVSDPDGKVVFERDHATNARGFYLLKSTSAEEFSRDGDLGCE